MMRPLQRLQHSSKVFRNVLSMFPTRRQLSILRAWGWPRCCSGSRHLHIHLFVRAQQQIVSPDMHLQFNCIRTQNRRLALCLRCAAN